MSLEDEIMFTTLLLKMAIEMDIWLTIIHFSFSSKLIVWLNYTLWLFVSPFAYYNLISLFFFFLGVNPPAPKRKGVW